MALPINISDLINRRVVENARVDYKADWNPEPILHCQSPGVLCPGLWHDLFLGVLARVRFLS